KYLKWRSSIAIPREYRFCFDHVIDQLYCSCYPLPNIASRRTAIKIMTKWAEHEISPPKAISASGRGSCCAAGLATYRTSAGVPDAARADSRGICRRKYV